MALGELKPQQPAFPYTAPLTQTLNDETLPIINKPKHPKKKGENKEQNGRTQLQEDKGTT